MPRDISTMRYANDFLYFFPLYKSITTGKTSIDLAYLLSFEKKHTLNFKNLSGFSEIITTDPMERIPEHKEYLTKNLPKIDRPLKEIVLEIIAKLKISLLKIIKPEDDTILMMSGGADSRIISWILSEIRKEHGDDRLGNLQFICHHPEGGEFLEAMKVQGWKEEQYRVHKKNQPDNADYYDYGNFEYNMNGYVPLSFNFWSDIVKPKEEKNWVWISGGYGGEMLQYPIDIKDLLVPNRFQMLKRLDSGFYFGYMHFILNCRDIVFPYINYDVLETIFTIPDKYYISTNRCNQKEGLIRAEILNQFDDKIPCHRGHTYNFTLNETRRKYIINMWKQSKFYKTFKSVPDVGRCDPTNPDRKGYGNKLYALATCYDKIGTI